MQHDPKQFFLIQKLWCFVRQNLVLVHSFSCWQICMWLFCPHTLDTKSSKKCEEIKKKKKFFRVTQHIFLTLIALYFSYLDHCATSLLAARKITSSSTHVVLLKHYSYRLVRNFWWCQMPWKIFCAVLI